MGSISCIDLSHHNAPKSFHQAFDFGIRLVMLKATQGTRFVDPTFEALKERVSQVEGMHHGAYHFGDGSDPIAQAEFFLNTAGDTQILCLDLEPNPSGKSMSIEQAEMFVLHLHLRTGRWPLLYGGSLLKEADLGESCLTNCELWLSQYSEHPVLPKGWKSWRLWQFTDGNVGPEPHSVPGIGNCDINRFNGSADDLARWAKGIG